MQFTSLSSTLWDHWCVGKSVSSRGKCVRLQDASLFSPRGCGASPECPSSPSNNFKHRVNTNRHIHFFFFFFHFMFLVEIYIMSSSGPQPLLSVVMGVLKMYDPYKWDTGCNANEKGREMTLLWFCSPSSLIKTHLVC